jgi:hypothetical protein
LAAVAVIAVAVACGGSSPTSPKVLPPGDPAAAPTRVIIGGKSVTLATELWRDFMPVSPPDGKPLAGVLRIRTEDGSNVPPDVAAETVWVMRGSETWATFLAAPAAGAPGPAYEVSFFDGPKWGPNEAVDVVVRLRDGTGRVVLLRAPTQTIRRTD